MSAHHRTLNRARWQAARREACERAGWECERCQYPGRLEVHHKVSLQNGGAPYDQGNLEVLCRSCHMRESGSVPVRGRSEWWRRLSYAVGE